MKKKQNKSDESYSQYSISVNSGERQNYAKSIPKPKKLGKSKTEFKVLDKDLEETHELKTSIETQKNIRHHLQFYINIDNCYEISDTETIGKPITPDRTSTHPKHAPISKSRSIPIDISSKILKNTNNKTLNIVKQEIEKNKAEEQKLKVINSLCYSSEESSENNAFTNRLSGEIFSFEEDESSN